MSVTLTQYDVTAVRDVPVPQVRIVVLADPHVCRPWTPLETLRGWIAAANAQAPDLILLLGDYVGHVWGSRPVPPAEIAAGFTTLSAPLGVFAVMGNHDWRDDPKAQKELTPTHWHTTFAAAGLPVLSNDAITLEKDGVSFFLAGLESQRAKQTLLRRTPIGADDIDATLAKTREDRFTLLMAHEPDIFPDLPDHVDLTLSGHTHGGQILPFGKPLVVPSKYGARYAYGHHRDRAKQLIVSGGLGFSGPPLRYGRPPEIVVIDIA